MRRNRNTWKRTLEESKIKINSNKAKVMVVKVDGKVREVKWGKVKVK